jgi:hypothetical protein
MSAGDRKRRWRGSARAITDRLGADQYNDVMQVAASEAFSSEGRILMPMARETRHRLLFVPLSTP